MVKKMATHGVNERRISYILGADVADALNIGERIYLCGDLKRSQPLEWVKDNRLEIGMSHYKGDGFQADTPHYHAANTEYNIILSGTSKFYLIDEKKEYEFEESSLVVIPPGTKYASKHKSGTKVLFVKVPSGDDKIMIDIEPFIKDWLNRW